MNRSRLISCTALVLALIAQNSFAGGVALSSTRVIYDGSRKEASLTVNNKSTRMNFSFSHGLMTLTVIKRRPLSSLRRYLN